MSTDLIWFHATRQKLPGLLVGMEAPEGPVFEQPETALAGTADFLVGYRVASGERRPTPSLVLLPDASVGELLGWLQTYSEESFPISQYCQVQLASEWRATSALARVQDSEHPLRQWAAASLIVGEMLAQAESDLNLTGVALSWSSACFSLPIVQLLRESSDEAESLLRLASERLQICEANPRFSRRAVTVQVLLPLWALLTKHEILRGSLGDICHLLVHALDSKAGEVLNDARGLLSSSAEHRVHSFDEVADKAMRMIRIGGAQRTSGAALVAAAALLVGNSTSHVELLRPTLAEAPESLAWFGLIAGFAGPPAWDSQWLKLVARVERQLSWNLDSGVSVNYDLSWIEYDFLSAGNAGPSVYDGFPKRFLRMLIVEILPGATCQFRLQGQHLPRSAVGQRLYSKSPSPEVSEPKVTREVKMTPSHRDRLLALARELARLAVDEPEADPGAERAQGHLFRDELPKNRKTTKGRTKPPPRS